MRGLYAITPELPDTNELIGRVRQAIAGGANVVQYRSKQTAPDIVRTQALALRELGWPGFVQVVLFMLLLLAGYIYVWRKGALDWGEEKRT